MKKILSLVVTCLAATFLTTSIYAAPPYCDPWPGCKKGDSGEDPGLSTCTTVLLAHLGIVEPPDGPALGPCTDTLGGSCDIVRPNDTTPGWIMKENCETTWTLEIPADEPLLDGGNNTLELIAPWSGGRAGIVNLGGAARVSNLDILVQDVNVANGTAGTGKVEAAISFDPHVGTSGLPRMTSFNIRVMVGNNAQFYNAIEYASTTGLDEVPLFAGSVSGNEIFPNSYSNSGILVTNINTTDNITGDSDNASISDNRVHPSSNGCIGIQVGPWVERANIEGNDVTLGCVIGGVGIRILSTGVAHDGLPVGAPPEAFEAPLPASIVKNIVNINDGNFNVGIEISDSDIGKNQGNVITGDIADQPYSVSNSGDVPFPTKGKKKNTCNGTNIMDSTTICP